MFPDEELVVGMQTVSSYAPGLFPVLFVLPVVPSHHSFQNLVENLNHTVVKDLSVFNISPESQQIIILPYQANR